MKITPITGRLSVSGQPSEAEIAASAERGFDPTGAVRRLKANALP